MNQDLIVVHEHMLTPTAQLADYVLPGDAWLERPSMMAGVSEQAMPPPGECRSVYWFWRELAIRLGIGEHFPWPTLEALYDHRLSPGGKTWQQAIDEGLQMFATPAERSYETRGGFATPTGKVELYSTVLEQLGFDPLPYYREAARPDAEYPLSVFIGVRDDEYFQTGHRHVPELRKRAPEPAMFMHPDDAASIGLTHGDWAWIATRHGKAVMRADIRPNMPKGLVRVPHGWWKPESGQGKQHLSGMWTFSDAQLSGDDDPSLMDIVQGIPHLKGVPCRVTKLRAAEVAKLEAEFGKASALPPGPKPVIATSDRAAPADFMYDPELGDGVQFRAAELALYGKGSLY